jgi:hypothetical protein
METLYQLSYSPEAATNDTAPEPRRTLRGAEPRIDAQPSAVGGAPPSSASPTAACHGTGGASRYSRSIS